MFQPDGYRKFLLNRATVSQPIIEYIESCLSSNNEVAQHVFHKIMILHWAGRDVNLFDMISEYFGGAVIPVQYQTQNILSTFYTSNLSLILKIIKLDFIFPYNRNMYNIDILFNDKTSIECFGNKVTLDDIVTGVVSKRFSDSFELNLSDFCNDPEFKQLNIYFYKFGLLSHFKILMLRMGRDTKLLNLSNNRLSQVPQDVLNFFIKGDLVAIDFSNNLIPSMSEMQRVSSRIESLWLEGNPLCDELDVTSYIRQIILRFPRLTELDGIKLNNHGVMLPFYRNYLATPDKRTKTVVERFITLYFAHYDGSPRDKAKLEMFYDDDIRLSFAADIPDADMILWANAYKNLARNLLKSRLNKGRTLRTRKGIMDAITMLPKTVHDLSSFCVDVLLHNKKHLIMVIDGVFKEICPKKPSHPFSKHIERYLSFRRTFLFTINKSNVNASTSSYHITKEMILLSLATPEQIENFKEPVRNVDTLSLVNPDSDHVATLCKAFMHITQLKSMEACEQRLKECNWDIKLALIKFQTDVQNNSVNPTKYMDADDFTDTSSLLEDEID
ncbi:nuclear RNA export factor 1-like [Epargyreus clarus]|uniref:nuclear RNA export factor 1-like n=1 Tax=Epargyreus clarus TaxID=520877 RepID=UPI003C2E4C75